MDVLIIWLAKTGEAEGRTRSVSSFSVATLPLGIRRVSRLSRQRCRSLAGRSGFNSLHSTYRSKAVRVIRECDILVT